ncbi:putative transferase membrane protein [Halobacteriovorax marinus SJ]|uniref:Transferase membrane protein n=1 Tax=Halobacteriovorax marinus (strain ATCC BAA-682 / DSM 15412 / SJ) TaxID=862908 RepID=E1X3X0_HALMS|nr:transferase membrane protein [Halobacteriovorax marinus]CBW25310.1 putative transferase membrane protein [Halobacteriovorax marinus SJ]
MKNLNNYKSILYISLLFHVLAAVFSTGFQHFDEHFQIYEFLNFKLGNIPSSNLPWEFREQIRPWFQVFIYFLIYKPLSIFGVESPFVFAFIFRLFTSLFGLFALTRVWPLIKIWIKGERYQLLTWAMLNLTWFVPYIQVRTNSESFGISFFLWGMSVFLLAAVERKNLVYAGLFSGLLFGFSYLSRSQMAFMVAFLWFWGMFINKSGAKLLISSAITILVAIGLGVLFDYWGYGNLTFSTWHYFRTNFLEGIMSSVKQYPWWWYFRLALNRGIHPVSLPLIIVTVWGWWKLRKHPLTWATLPLFIFHCYVGHKELRYIFPIIILTPIFCGLFISTYRDKIEELYKKKWLRGIWKFCVYVNFLFLIIATFRAANPSVDFYKFVWKSEIKTLNVHGENPFTMLGLPLEFYKKKDLVINEVKSFPAEGEHYLFFNKGRFVKEMEKHTRCELIYLTYPKWVLKFNIGNWISRSRVWSIYKCL